jgi:hypothetical protein
MPCLQNLNHMSGTPLLGTSLPNAPSMLRESAPTPNVQLLYRTSVDIASNTWTLINVRLNDSSR